MYAHFLKKNMSLVPWSLVFFCFLVKYCTCDGYFEIQIISMENIRKEISDGTCCGSRNNLHVNHTCSGDCDTYFKICLKQYQYQVTYQGQCMFGNRTTSVLGGNSFEYSLNNSAATVKLPFQFAWPVSSSDTVIYCP